jgi:predicted RNA-binding Zn-ribbon protein involved in translation (DUF1610 family)
MVSIVEEIDVVCPKCGEEYIDWYRPSFDPAASSTCPRCGHEIAEDQMMREDGIWTLVTDEAEPLER